MLSLILIEHKEIQAADEFSQNTKGINIVI